MSDRPFERRRQRTPADERHVPCPRRRRETRDGVTMDWCYAIGVEELGDMPCEYCRDKRKGKGK